MKRNLFRTLIAVSILFSSPADASQTAEGILNAVVKIRALVPKDAHTAETLGTEREGNGVIIDSKGHILTAGYLVVEAESIEVTGSEGRRVTATFIGYDHVTGFGLLRADKPLEVAPMKLGQSSAVKQGDPVLVAGYGGKDAVQAGRVLSRKEFAGYWEYLLEDAIFTIPVYPNFGGAALIDPEGRLLGIGSLFTQVAIQGVGSIPCNVFIPIDLLTPILNDLMTKGRQRASRPWLGVNLEEAHGRIFITKLTPGGPAERAGLKVGDLILAARGNAVNGLADFYRKVWALGSAGVEVSLRFLRGTEILNITVHSVDRYHFLLLKPKKVT